jgi:FtsP/CotA-like multicopper oxidase with cupredoxin domain
MNRREFSKAILAGVAVSPWARQGVQPASAGNSTTSLRLAAVTRTIDINGRPAKVFGLVGADGKAGLHLAAGETNVVTLTNGLSEETLIHWHGLRPPWNQDGVPGAPMSMLKAGEERVYQLPGGESGTHWMHAHSLQEQNLLAAPLIVRSPEERIRDEQEVVVLLHDFSFTPADELLAGLKSSAGVTEKNMNMEMAGDMAMQGMDHSAMPGMMMGGMMGMDVNDIEYDAYLANDRTLADPEVVSVEKGGRVRLRIINGATATQFTIDTGLLEGEVTAVDGQDIVPFSSRQFPLSMGQRVDIRLSVPREGGAYPVLALREGGIQRTGILATRDAGVRKLAEKGDEKGPPIGLAYEAGLRAARNLAPRPAERLFTADLHGAMQGYQWSIRQNSPLQVRPGERVQVEMTNKSMMSHPMHLHGHHFQIVGINGRALMGAMRDTVIVPPMARVTFAFDALNPGDAWAFHCHHLYHMASGMMTTLGYEGA